MWHWKSFSAGTVGQTAHLKSHPSTPWSDPSTSSVVRHHWFQCFKHVKTWSVSRMRLKLCCYLDNCIVDNSVEHFDLIVLLRKGRWCGVSVITDAGLITAAGVSGVASRSFTTTRRSSKPLASGERANVLLSVEMQYSKAKSRRPKASLAAWRPEAIASLRLS